MATEQLFQTDSYLRSFDATVTSVDDGVVVLDRTASTPEEAGSPTISARWRPAGASWR